MVHVSNPFKPDTSFYKVRSAGLPHALYLSGQLKLFHIYPVNMVNSQKK
jgi:hypothetical protein